MPSFPVIDSHVHFIDPQQFSYRWLTEKQSIDKQFLPADFAKTTGNVAVEAVIFVEAWADSGQHLREAQFAQDSSNQGVKISGIVANVPVVAGSDVADDLQELCQLKSLRGARYLIEGAIDPSFCLEPDFIAGVQLVTDAGLPFDLCLKSWALPFATELVRRMPETRFVLDHIGKPAIKQGLREPWWTGIAEFAKLPNTVCKISGVISEADHAHWSEATIRPYVERAIECFGFERVMFGSDWPVSELTHSYQTWVDTLDNILADASESENLAFYRETAIKTYGLPIPTDLATPGVTP